MALDARIRVAAQAASGVDRFAIRPYPQDLEQWVEWQGRLILLRPIRPEDAAQHYAFFRLLDPEDIHYRTFMQIRDLERTLGVTVVERRPGEVMLTDVGREIARRGEDVLTASRGTGRPHPAGTGALDPETRRFLESAAIEGEIRDSQTNVLLAEGVDRRREIPASETWGQVDRAFDFWAERMSAGLERRTGAR